jgi:hypothetical protein
VHWWVLVHSGQIIGPGTSGYFTSGYLVSYDVASSPASKGPPHSMVCLPNKHSIFDTLKKLNTISQDWTFDHKAFSNIWSAWLQPSTSAGVH